MMMNRIVFAAALSPICLVVANSRADEPQVQAAQSESANEQGVAEKTVLEHASANASNSWESDYGTALEATRSDNRPLLVVIEDATQAQGTLDELLTQTQLTDDANNDSNLLAPYRLCKIDAATDYGKKVARVFGATQLPCTAIIDKTGAVVLFKKFGPITEDQWKTALGEHRLGQRRSRAAHTAFYRGITSSSQNAQPQLQSYPTYSVQPSLRSPSYCPNCQRRASQAY